MSPASSPSLLFHVKHGVPKMIAPASPTPRELKPLSDIDDQEGLRFQIPFIFFYKSNPSVEGSDPISVVREALGKALVYYYPLAGRLKEGPNRKLVVDCTGELGVLFIAATADIRFEQFGGSIRPPFPNLDEFLYNVPGSDGILGCPLLLIQVTRLSCGGFILALRLNHTICDAFGIVQFLKTMSEMAKGAKFPSIPPVWQRELLNARTPPRITCSHQEYEDLTTSTTPSSNGPNTANFIQRSFFFGPNEMKAIRRHLPPNFPHCSQFALLTACLWRCRTLALEFDPEQDVLMCSLVNARGKSFGALGLPSGYYGNAFAYPAAVAKAGDLSRNSLGFAVELMKKAIAEVSEEYFRSVADLMVIRGRPLYKTVGIFLVSDNRHVGYEEVDFEWGSPEYAGLATSFPVISFYMRCKSEGEEGVVVPISLPLVAMERFQQELEKMIT